MFGLWTLNDLYDKVHDVIILFILTLKVMCSHSFLQFAKL